MRRRITSAAILPFFLLMTLPACDVPPDDPEEEDTLEGAHTTSYSGEDLYKGLLFGDGPVANLIPAVRNNWKLDIIVQGQEDVNRVRKFQGEVIKVIKRLKPDFFSQFKTAIYSRNATKITKALADGSKIAGDAIAKFPEYKIARDRLAESYELTSSEKSQALKILQPGSPTSPAPVSFCGPTFCGPAIVLVAYIFVAAHSYLAVWAVAYLAVATKVKIGTGEQFGDTFPPGLTNEMFVAQIASTIK
jgi:SdpC family antimicrobial peptide